MNILKFYLPDFQVYKWLKAGVFEVKSIAFLLAFLGNLIAKFNCPWLQAGVSGSYTMALA
jgi:hypothetical protein